jgi:hypothetical protein
LLHSREIGPKNTTESEGILPAVVNKPAVQTEVAVIDTIPVKTDRYGLRVGIDLFRLTRAFYDEYKGLELVGDYRLTKKYFLAAELGNETKLMTFV